MTDGGNTWQPPDPGSTPPAGPPGGGFGPPSGGFDPPDTAPPGPPPGAPSDQPTAPVEATPAGPSGGGRSPGKVVAAAIGAVAIVGAGVFAITRISGDASAGGASSPEAAGEALLDALDAEDVLGAVDVLLPGERETFRQPLQDLVSELERLEVLDDDDLSSIGGIDIQVTDREVTAEETNVDDIANLTVTATVATSVDGEALPIGDWIRDSLEEDEIAEIDQESPAVEDSFPVTAVRKDGRWYLSLLYTAAEQARAQTDAAIPEEGIALNGGDSPEAAMDNFLAAAGDLDLGGMLGTLNPNEFEALQRYAPLFLDDAQRELDDIDASVEISDTAYTVEGSGSKRSIAITAATIDMTVEGDELTGRFEDGCWIVEVDGEEMDSCEVADQLSEELDLDEVLDDPQAIEDGIAEIQEAFADYSNPGLIVREVDGSWYLSPMATASDQVLAVIRALTREEIEHLTEVIRDLAATLEDEIGNLEDEIIGGGLDVPTLEDFERPADTGDDPSPTTDGDDEPESLLAPCADEADAADAAACYDDLLRAGDLEEVEVPWFLRHPECGVGDLMWSGEYFALEDDEFVATVEDLQPCVQDLLEAGDVEELELTQELMHPDCLDGRNPYLLADDDPAFDDFLDCALS